MLGERGSGRDVAPASLAREEPEEPRSCVPALAPPLAYRQDGRGAGGSGNFSRSRGGSEVQSTVGCAASPKRDRKQKEDIMAAAKQGDTVRVHYSGTLRDGTEFDSSRDASALEFTLGEGQIIPGFEEAVIGMSPGERKSVEIPCAQAYGAHRAELTQEVDRTVLPEGVEVQPGLQLQAMGPGQEPLTLQVSEVKAETVVLDANHPLAGEDLFFDIELVELL